MYGSFELCLSKAGQYVTLFLAVRPSLIPVAFAPAIMYRFRINVFTAEGKCAARPGLSDTAMDNALTYMGGGRIAKRIILRGTS